MKNKKRFFSVLVLSIVLFGMFIIGCNNSGKDVIAQGGDTENVSTQGTDSSESSTEKSTESLEETETVETTEETETTEEELPDEAESSLKEEEEILKITPTNDSKNNGSGSSEKEVYNAPTVASVDNPIIKVATGTLPVEFSSGNIPAGKTWYYKVTAAKGSYLCIEDESAAIISGGKTYQVNEEGKVLFKVPQLVTEVAIKNSAKETKNFKVSVVELEALPGTKDNPDVIAEIMTKDKATAIVTSLEAGDKDGYYYEWTATQDAIVDFTVAATSASELEYDIIISVNGGTAVSMSGSGVANDEGTAVTTSVVVVKGDVVTIQVIAKKDADNNYPAVAKASFTPICIPYGAEDYPVVLGLEQVPGTYEVEIPAGETVYYNSGIIGGAEMSIEDVTANVIYQDNTYKAENGVVSVLFAETTDLREPICFAIKNTGTSDKAYTLIFKKEYPEGSIDNPVKIEAGKEAITHTFEEGEEGYYYQWTAPGAGTMTFDISTTTENGWQYSISKEAEENPVVDGPYDSEVEEKVLTRTYTVLEGDVFIIKISTYEAEALMTPAGTISFKLSFTVTANGVNATNPETQEAVESTEESESTEITESTEEIESTEITESTEEIESTEITESTEEIENTEIIESVEENESAEMLEDSETVEIVEPIALRLIRNLCIRLFAK